MWPVAVGLTLPPALRRSAALRSTVVLKAAMAVSGLLMVLFLLAHMYGNLKAFHGRAEFDAYAHFLRTMGRPVLPNSGALWIIRFVLIVSVLTHILAALTLWRRSRLATGGRGGARYESTHSPRGVQRTYASFTMRWGGVTIALFVVYHLLNLSADNVIHPGGASGSPYVRLVNSFQIWWVVASYTIALIAVGMHIRHGFWSAFASLGANTSVRRRRRLNVAATAIAVLMTIGFLVTPYAVLTGWVSD